MSSKLAVPPAAALFRQASVLRINSSMVVPSRYELTARAAREAEFLSQQFCDAMSLFKSLARRNHRSCAQVARFIERVDSRAFSILFLADSLVAISPERQAEFLEVMSMHRQAFSRDPGGITLKWRVFAVVARNPRVEELLRQLSSPAQEFTERHLCVLYARQGLKVNQPAC